MPKRSLLSSLPSIVAALVCLALLVSTAACGASEQGGQDSGPISVVTSINQWSSLVTQLGGDRVEVKTILKNTSTDAHDYEPTTADIAMISKADLVIVNGAGLDGWATKAAKTNGTELVDLAARSGHRTGDNPHIWFSSQARSNAAKAVTQAYKKLRPRESKQFDSLNKAWNRKQTELKERIAKVGEDTRGKRFAATESVANYLTEDLGMEDLTPQGYLRAAANESEPSPDDIRQFQELLREAKVDLLVFNSQESNSVTDQIMGASMASKIPVVRVSEQMPSEYQTLEDWIDALIEEFATAAD